MPKITLKSAFCVLWSCLAHVLHVISLLACFHNKFKVSARVASFRSLRDKGIAFQK